jgi:RHH-type proline utilization regulon transcriptional repressor/proline dehydrogenase/delta 1-pyrroline-5-carboxylate dehydrogenase
MPHSIARDLDSAAPDVLTFEALRQALGPIGWRPRAQALAAGLAAGRRPWLDVQRVFSLLPPETAAGEALFRLAEALPRTPDRDNRLALLEERVGRAAGAALPLARLGLSAMSGRFVYADTIDAALARARRQAARRPAARFSFDMLGEGARTAHDAARNYGHYAAAIDAAGRAQGPRERFGVSIKLSSIHERYDAQGYGSARGALLERLGSLCRAAAAAGIGLSIDAEESERLPLHLDLFAALAASAELLRWDGLGIVVQAYQQAILRTVDEVVGMARERKARGGARIRVRLVKGAYWDAEVKRAQDLGLGRYPVFTDKGATDLAYLAAARRLLEHPQLLQPQFATHNPVTIACVAALAEGRDFELQRLHGMGESLEPALRRLLPSVAVRVYAPVGPRSDLLAYLVRRLLENGASTSFVRQAAVARDAQALLADGFAFLDAVRPSNTLTSPLELHMPERLVARGHDLAHPGELASMAHAVARRRGPWRAAPLTAAGTFAAEAIRVHSPARPGEEIGEVVNATPDAARAAIASACAAQRGWSQTDAAVRAAIVERIADRLENDMEELVALCAREAGKTLADGVADVREAVDFCRYYAAQARRLFSPLQLKSPAGESNVLTLHGRGVFACISPWNFPVAIFTGQVVAALAAGNTVVAKPAEQTPLTAFRVARLMLDAGIPADVLHLLPGDGSIGQAIVEDPRIAGVAFTGSNQTARAIQRALAAKDGPIVPFIAETGGLNAMIVDSTALPEQVVDAVVASAFRSAGQRCSSLRMLYLQEEIAPRVLELLRGATAALRIGDPADAATDVGPLIDEDARRALATYVASLRGGARLVAEAGPAPREGWYLSPVAFEVGSIRDLPGERFGPILHVARFRLDELDRVIDEVNATGYGLTMGVHTRIDARAERIRSRAAVGNLYVNRNTIGAVVGVQPFGGEGLSGTGPKAGGPHYLPRFATERVYTVNTAAAGGDLRLLTGRT